MGCCPYPTGDRHKIVTSNRLSSDIESKKNLKKDVKCWHKNPYNFIVLAVLEGKCIRHLTALSSAKHSKSLRKPKLSTSPPCALLSSFFSVFLPSSFLHLPPVPPVGSSGH